MRDIVHHPITYEEKIRALDWALVRYNQWLAKSHIIGDIKGAVLLAIKEDLKRLYEHV